MKSVVAGFKKCFITPALPPELKVPIHTERKRTRKRKRSKNKQKEIKKKIQASKKIFAFAFVRCVWYCGILTDNP